MWLSVRITVPVGVKHVSSRLEGPGRPLPVLGWRYGAGGITMLESRL